VFVRDIRSGKFGQDNPKFITPDKAIELSTHKVSKGDVLITKMGDPPGDANVYTPNKDGIITADCIRLRLNDHWIPDYVALAINSSPVRAQIGKITRGVAQQKVSLSRFRREVQIPVPPIELQKTLLEMARDRLGAIDRLEGVLGSIGRRELDLRQSLLNDAFLGRLVEQDSADEPASVLLERIRAERAAQGPVRRGKGKTAPQEETLV
jgi:type I restriction enzyme S subunit